MAALYWRKKWMKIFTEILRQQQDVFKINFYTAARKSDEKFESKKFVILPFNYSFVNFEKFV